MLVSECSELIMVYRNRTDRGLRIVPPIGVKLEFAGKMMVLKMFRFSFSRKVSDTGEPIGLLEAMMYIPSGASSCGSTNTMRTLVSTVPVLIWWVRRDSFTVAVSESWMRCESVGP